MTVSISNLNFTWANSSNIFTAIGANVNAASYDANSRILRFRVNSTTVFDVDVNGNITANTLTLRNPAANLTLETFTANTVTANTVNANIYYDSSNTNFYVNPAGTSELYSANFQRALFVPRYTVYIDATNGGRTTPNTFTKSYTASHVSFGTLLGPYFGGFGAGGSYLFEMNVRCTSATSVTSYIHFVDDNSYFFLNRSLLSSVTGSGGKNTSITWDFLEGLNTIHIVLNNSGGATSSISYIADYFQNGNTAFVPP